MASKAVAAKASPATAGKKLHAPQPQAKVRINFKEPLKTGFLSKAGKTNKSFKNRFFVLYKNFLVYYDDETKWKRDVTVERLESRNGAVNLTGAVVSIPSGEMGVSFGFLLRAPHNSNKRDIFLLGTSSDGERLAWMEAMKADV
jgi:hypothetical protein